nr:MAG TPA: hypothetical protein [Caudoviricetes sp.]
MLCPCGTLWNDFYNRKYAFGMHSAGFVGNGFT